MTKSVYIIAPEALPAKSAVAFGALTALSRAYDSVAIFRPIICSEGRDQAVHSLLSQANNGQDYQSAFGVTYADVRHGRDDAIMTIISKYAELAEKYDAIVVLGSDYSDVIGPIEFSLNAEIAANLNSAGLLVLTGNESPDDLRHAADFCLREMDNQYLMTIGIVAVDVDPNKIPAYQAALDGHPVPVKAFETGRVNTEIALPDTFVPAFQGANPHVRTALMFQHELIKRANADMRTIVLPESNDDRILRSAALVRDKGIANLILLGDKSTIDQQAAGLGLDLTGIAIQDPTDPALVEQFAEEYTKLRAHKGMTIDKARETLTDLSYFGTMMIHMGMADGMVSGAIHTTANTIRPSLEFIKTRPGVSHVSGYFLMCLQDRVYVFADCAVNTNPSPEALAEIAIASAATAASFQIDPKVALLSYSTGTSGAGPDVDAVAEATRILKERAPELACEGPIQFDAAVDATVAKTKLPNSPVAGHATVFIFPDLNTGNTTYKAVQRTANALAIGPILQGLKKPVNDLSRGALVDDIVNTIAITAIQAQSEA